MTTSEKRRQGVVMDNRQVDVTSCGKEQLALALELLSNGLSLTKYLEEDGQLVLLWGTVPDPKATTLLYPVVYLWQMTDFVWGWLESKAEYRGEYPDGDVKNERGGWRAWCGPWGKDDKYEFGFARVEARYAWIGK